MAWLVVHGMDSSSVLCREREVGNARFKANDLPGALACYSRAINIDPTSHLAFSNRAMVYLKLGNPSEAFSDCSWVRYTSWQSITVRIICLAS